MLNRDQNIDFTKGLLIFGVLWGHLITALSAGHWEHSVWIHTFICTYDMPFFMLISGYFLHISMSKHSIKELAINKLGTLLLPLVVWNLAKHSWSSYYFVWAVLISSFICMTVHTVAQKLKIKWVEPIIYIAFTGLLHYYSIPWNLYYLFPFFCVGFFIKNIHITISTKYYALFATLFAIGLCFWNDSYTPWECGFDAWKTDSNAFVIYGYRFILALLGIVTMSKLFQLLFRNIPSVCTNWIVKAGQETLAIYLIQGLIIEKLLVYLMTICNTSFYNWDLTIIHNLIGYIVAPSLALTFIYVTVPLIEKIKSVKCTKWIFGIKFI